MSLAAPLDKKGWIKTRFYETELSALDVDDHVRSPKDDQTFVPDRY